MFIEIFRGGVRSRRPGSTLRRNHKSAVEKYRILKIKLWVKMKKKKLTKTERDIVHLRYYDHLYSYEIAEKLSMTVHQVKYRLRKPNVKEYIRKKVVPKICKHTLDYIDKCSAKPVGNYVTKLMADSEAQTCRRVGPGKRIHYCNSVKCNRKHFQAVSKALRIYGVTGDQKNIERDLRKAIAKHVLWLKEMRGKWREGLRLGKCAFIDKEWILAKKRGFLIGGFNDRVQKVHL
jgi:hypothetical protein